jgi:hypothetical protein
MRKRRQLGARGDTAKKKSDGGKSGQGSSHAAIL